MHIIFNQFDLPHINITIFVKYLIILVFSCVLKNVVTTIYVAALYKYAFNIMILSIIY